MKEKINIGRNVILVFAVAASVAGLLFLDSNVTGNATLNASSSVGLISTIGLMLISCSIILIAYLAKKR